MNDLGAARQVNFEFEQGNEAPKRSSSAPIVRLTDRDLELLKFVLEMRFASLEDLHQRFFRKLSGGGESHSLLWARDRLAQLRRAGFLAREYSFAEGVKLNVATLKAYRALVANEPSAFWIKPYGAIDHRTFEHDRFVLQARLELEETSGVFDWISDRKLKMGLGSHYGLAAESVPDAIYKMPDGSSVAFELEVTQKSKSRYREKIRRYVKLMRERRQEASMFRQVHYRCLLESIAVFLQSETRIYGEMFKIEFVETTLGRKRGRK